MNGALQPINLGKSLDELNLMIAISTQLADCNKFAALCIKTAIKSDMPARTIIATLKDMIEDNWGSMIEILGDDLLNRIKNFEV